jgi:hypothetical protein
MHSRGIRDHGLMLFDIGDTAFMERSVTSPGAFAYSAVVIDLRKARPKKPHSDKCCRQSPMAHARASAGQPGTGLAGTGLAGTGPAGKRIQEARTGWSA